MFPSNNELKEADKKNNESNETLVNDEYYDKKIKRNITAIKNNWFYSIQKLFLRNPIHSVIPTYNNILLVHVDTPLYAGLKNLIHKQLSFLLIYDKQIIIGHVDHQVLLEYFIYFYNFLKLKNEKKEKIQEKEEKTENENKNENENPLKKSYNGQDPSEFTFRDILRISSRSKRLALFEKSVDCLTVWNHLLKYNEQVVYIEDKTKGIITAAVQTRDLIFYILMNSKGKCYELHSSASPCLKRDFIVLYSDYPLNEVLVSMYENNLSFVPIIKRENDTYLDYFSLDDLFTLYQKMFLENVSVEPEKHVIFYLTLLRTQQQKKENNETKGSQKDVTSDVICPFNNMLRNMKMYKVTNESNIWNYSQRSETIINNQQFTIKNSLQSLFYSKINALVVLSEKNCVEGIVTLQSLFEYLRNC